MSYGLKYYAEFKDYFDNDITVNIYGRDFAGTSTEVKLIKESEVIISYPGDDRNLYHSIFGSQAKIKMLSESNFQFIDLHSSDSRGHRVDILKNDTLDWRGWILPDLFNEPYIAPPYPIEITARCGLGELKERDIPEKMTKLLKGAALVIDVDSFVNLYTIIGNALLGIETSLPLNDCINLHYDLAATSNDSALFDTYVDLSMYKGMTYYEVFEDILKTFGARIYQQNGEWWIVRVDEFREELTARKWTVSRPINNSFVLSETKLTTFLVGKPTYSATTGGLIANNSPSLDILPAWKEFNIVHNLGKKDSILENSEFQEWDENTLEDWEIYNTDNVFRVSDSEDSSYLEIISNGWTFSKLQNRNYIRQTLESVEAIDNTIRDGNLFIKVSFDVYRNISPGDESSPGQTYFICEIKLVGSTETYYLKKNPNIPRRGSDVSSNQNVWSTDVSNLQITSFDESVVGRLSFKEVELTADYFPVDGDLTVTIYSAIGITTIEYLFALKEFSIILKNDYFRSSREGSVRNQLENSYITDDITELVINSSVNENNIYTPDDIEVMMGDLPEIPNKRHFWKNFFSEDDGEPTVDWKEKDGTTKLPILNILANDIAKRVGRPQFKLSVPILSPVIEFDSCIVDFLVPLVSGKKYLCNSASKNYQTGIFHGEYIEFTEWENIIWILAEGTWNDYGVWLDSEIWNDDDSDLIEFDLSRDDEILPKIWNITALVGIANGDTIDKLLPDSNLIYGDFLYEDNSANEIDSVPYTFTGTVLAFRASLFKNQSYSTYFNATIGGNKKIIKINVNL